MCLTVLQLVPLLGSLALYLCTSPARSTLLGINNWKVFQVLSSSPVEKFFKHVDPLVSEKKKRTNPEGLIRLVLRMVYGWIGSIKDSPGPS